MKPSNTALLILLWLTFATFGQARLSANTSDERYKMTPGKEKLKADLLQDIALGSLPEQGKDFARLGDLLWDVDRTQGIYFFTKAISIALDKKTKYKDESERLNAIKGILFSNRLIKKDERLSNKVLPDLLRLLYRPTPKHDGSLNTSRIYIALQLLEKDEKLAFNLAIRSLEGKKPALDSNSTDFFSILARKKNPLADAYFRKLVEAIGKSDDSSIVVTLLDRMKRTTTPAGTLYRMFYAPSDQQLKLVLETLLPFIERESKELSRNRRKDCSLTVGHGQRLLAPYRKLLPDKVGIVEAAIKTCKTSNIEPHLKPGFRTALKLKTSQDYENFAKTLDNKELRESWLFSAALKAKEEKDYRNAIRIMDGLDRYAGGTQLFGALNTRLQVSTTLILDLIKQQQFAEIKGIYDATPEVLRPYLLLDVFRNADRNAANTSLVLADLFSQVKNDFAKMNFPLPTRMGFAYPINPAKYVDLVDIYSRSGRNDLALQTFKEYITLQNELSTKYAGLDKEGHKIAYTHFNLSSGFIEQNFETVCDGIAKLEAVQIRKRSRELVLSLSIRNGSTLSSGIVRIN